MRALIPGLGGPRSYPRVVSTWEDAVAKLSDVDAAETKSSIEDELLEAESVDDYAAARKKLLDLAASAEVGARRLRALADHVTLLQQDWVASRRYTAAGLDALVAELEQQLATDPVGGARAWLAELFDAFRAREQEALSRLTAEFPFDAERRPGADRIRRDVDAWLANDAGAGLALFDALARADVKGWEEILDVPARTRAHRLAAWVALRVLGDTSTAEQHVEAAVELWPVDGTPYAERAAFHLFSGELDRAAPDAQRAIELEPEDPYGYLVLGTWAELAGHFDEAHELFGRALDRMPVHVIALIRKRASLIDASGGLLFVAAERLLALGRLDEALMAADAALLTGVLGASAFPEAVVYRLRSRVLSEIGRGRETEAAAASVEAGKRYLWSGLTDEAIGELRRAHALDASNAEAGWLLADALTTNSFPVGAAVPDADLVAEALEVWETSARKFDPPSGPLSWAFLTRATIADLVSRASDKDRGLGSWEAALHVERALVHDDAEPRRWGFAARHIRACRLELTALEAADRGYSLDPSDSVVLSERLALLANAARYDDAADTAEALLSFGPDPWVSGVQAWLAYHRGRSEEALKHLEAPLELEYDLGWYYALRINCLLDLGDVDAACAASRDLVTRVPPIGPTARLQLALAHATLGDLDQAHAVLEESPAGSEDDYAFAKFFVAMVEGNLDRAQDQLETIIRVSTSPREVDDTVREARLRLTLLAADERAAHEAVVERAMPVAEALRAELLVDPPTADRELSAMLEHDPGQSGADLDLATAALLAIRARRLAQSGDLLAAADGYERLLASLFEPEATVALSRSLSGASAQRTAEKDVDAVVAIQERMRSLELTDDVQAGLAVAAAMEIADRVAAACTYLVALLDEDIDDVGRLDVHQRLGELWLRAGNLDDAKGSFQAALAIARERNDTTRSAELEARLGLVALGSSDEQEGYEHVESALRDWQSAGAFDPKGPLEADLHGLSRSDGTTTWSSLATVAVQKALEYLEKRRESARKSGAPHAAVEESTGEDGAPL